MKIAFISQKGRNLRGQKLDEDNLTNALFLHGDRIFRSGNRYHNLVEGLSIESGEFIDTFYMEDINIIKIKKIKGHK